MDIRAILMGLAFAAMWSSAFTSARIIAPPMGSLALRFLLSGMIGIALALAMGQSFRLTRAQWRATLVFGVCQNAIYLGLNFIAMQTIEASLASIIASTMPLMVALAGWLVFRERLIMGARLGAGVDLNGLSLCIIAAVALTVATLSVRGASSGGNVMMIVGLQMLVGAALLAVASAALEWPFEVQVTRPLVLAFLYTTLVPGLAATFVWFTLVNRIGAVKASTFHFLNPFFGVAVAALLLGEKLGPLDMIGVAIVGGGILAVQLARQGGPKPVPKTPRSVV